VKKYLLTYIVQRCIYEHIQLMHSIYTGDYYMLIEFKGVSKKLGKFKMNQISFDLPKGYIMGLIGPNGAGKTTLIHLILGLYKPDEGEIYIDGKRYEDCEQDIREMLGCVLLEDLFDPALTLRQNGDEYGSFYKNYDGELLNKYLTRFNLEGNRRFKELSKGEKLKFQFAFALSHDAKLLILDEPTGNFDSSFRQEFFKILKEFIADGERSVVLSTHLTEDLDRIADYICYLDKGNLLFAGDVEKLHDKYRIAIGEDYKIKLLRNEHVIHVEKGEYGTRALIEYHKRIPYDKEITLTVPTIEELMYFITKSGQKGKKKK